MPITPFHFGLGSFIKSILPKYFSFRVFVLSNIFMDVETIYFILTNQYPAHRFFHTYLGATVVAIASVIIGRPICYRLTNRWNIVFKIFKISNERISMLALVTAAFIGVSSHVMLDGIMHQDVQPLYPWLQSNGLLHILSYGQLHLFCFLIGVIGIVIYCINKDR